MKAVILAGGLGTRLSEETSVKPKPMVEIGGRPMLWHIMKIYERHGINDFIVCLGYKGEYIKSFFRNYSDLDQNFIVNTKTGQFTGLSSPKENWNVTLLDTGIAAMTGGRIRSAIESLGLNDDFHLTYGDGVSDVNLSELTRFHFNHKKLCTVTAVTPPGRFGVLDISGGGVVNGFREKVISDQYRINGGFFIVNPGVAKLISGPDTVWEQGPMEAMAREGQLMAFLHDGFWRPMDTLRDKNELERLACGKSVPWL